MPKGARWKKDQNRRKVNYSLKLGLIALSILFGFVILSKMISVVGNFNHPFANWDNAGRINLVIGEKEVSLLSYNPVSKTALILKIPSDTYVEVPYNFGSWPLGSVYKLGQAEKRPMGGPLLSSSIGSSFGVPVDGFIITTKDVNKELFGGYSGLKLFGAAQTNLSILEYLNLWWGLRGVRFDKLEIVDQKSIVKKITLPDGSPAYSFDQPKLDVFTQNKFIDSKIEEEGLTVAIFNATSYPNLAAQAARIVTNMGGRVITTSNLYEQKIKSFVSGKSSYTKKRLSKIFALACGKQQTKECEMQNEQLENLGADINIILGEDYYLRYKDLLRSQ